MTDRERLEESVRIDYAPSAWWRSTAVAAMYAVIPALVFLLVSRNFRGLVKLGIVVFMLVIIAFTRTSLLVYRRPSNMTDPLSSRDWWLLTLVGLVMLSVPFLLYRDWGRGGVVGLLVVTLVGGARLLTAYGPSGQSRYVYVQSRSSTWMPFAAVLAVALAIGFGAAVSKRTDSSNSLWMSIALLGGIATAVLCGSELLEVIRTSKRSVEIGWLMVVPVVAFVIAGAFFNPWLIAVSVALAPIPTALLGTLKYFGTDNDLGYAVRMIGALSLVTGLMWFIFGAARPMFAFVVAMFLVLLIWAVTSNTNADALLVIALLAVSAGTIPRTADPSSSASDSAGRLYAVGDSWISGEGGSVFETGTNTISPDSAVTNQCRRSLGAYPRTAASELRLDLAFFGCSGAISVNLSSQGQYRNEPPSPRGAPIYQTTKDTAQLNLVDKARNDTGGKATDWLVVSVGGNDARFSTVGIACLVPGNCAELVDVFRGYLREMEQQLDRTYADIRRRFGATMNVLIVPYPNPIRDRGCSTSLFSDEEHQFLAGFVSELNTVVSGTAKEHGFLVADTESAFADANGQICQAADPKRWMVNLIALHPTGGEVRRQIDPTQWLHNSIHPSDEGHRQIAPLVVEAIGRAQPAGRDATPPSADPAAGRPPLTARIGEGCIGPDCVTLESYREATIRRVAQSEGPPAALILLGAWLTYLQPTERMRMVAGRWSDAVGQALLAVWRRVRL